MHWFDIGMVMGSNLSESTLVSVPTCVLQVVACRLDNNDNLRLSTKDVEHGLHGGGHV